MGKLTSGEGGVRRECLRAIESLLMRDDPDLVDIKLEIVKKLGKRVQEERLRKRWEGKIVEILSKCIERIHYDQRNREGGEGGRVEELRRELRRKRSKGEKEEVRKKIKEIMETGETGADPEGRRRKNKEIKDQSIGMFLYILRHLPQLVEPVLTVIPTIGVMLTPEVLWLLIQNLKQLTRALLDEQEHSPERISKASKALFACCQLLMGPGADFKIEERELLGLQYELVLLVGEEVSYMTQEDFKRLLQALYMTLVERRVLSISIVGSFLKRLALLTPHLSCGQVRGVLQTMRIIIETYPRAQNMLEEKEGEDTLKEGNPDHTDAIIQSSITRELGFIESKWGKRDRAIGQLVEGIRKRSQGGGKLWREKPWELLEM